MSVVARYIQALSAFQTHVLFFGDDAKQGSRPHQLLYQSTGAALLDAYKALVAAARQGGDVQQAPAESPQSGAKRNARKGSA